MAGKSSKKPTKVAKKTVVKPKPAKPKLLSGGNPQIAKADGDAPVQAFIAAMPGWKRPQGRALELTLLWHREPGLVPELPLHDEVHQGGVFQRHVVAPSAAGGVQEQGRTLFPHLRERADRREARVELDQTGREAARLGEFQLLMEVAAATLNSARVPGSRSACTRG